jgi:hypothetical protein
MSASTGIVDMKDVSDMLFRFSERVRIATKGSAGLDAKEVASILKEIEDVLVRRKILAQFLALACSKGDVSEVVAWAVVMSHMEGRRPTLDVQEAAKHLLSAH